MPNWCSNAFRIYGDKTKVLECFIKWSAALSNHPPFEPVKNSWDESWLGNLWLGEGYTEDEVRSGPIRCRGHVETLELDKDGKSIILNTETAWEPNYEDMMELIKKKHPGLDMVMLAEEHGCEVYINTDVDHKFFKDQWIIDGYIKDKKLGEEILGGSEYYYCDQEDEFVDRVNEILGTKFVRPKEILDLTTNEIHEMLNAKYGDDENWLSIDEFEDWY